MLSILEFYFKYEFILQPLYKYIYLSIYIRI